MGLFDRARSCDPLQVGRARQILVALVTWSLALVLTPAPGADATTDSNGTLAPLSPGPPEATFISPPMGALISGTGDIRVLARDDTGVVVPAAFYLARANAPGDHLGKEIPSADPPGTSAPSQEVTLTAALDTTRLPDTEYRVTARVADDEGSHTIITNTIRTDNHAPRVRIHRPRGPGDHRRHSPNRSEEGLEDPLEDDNAPIARQGGRHGPRYPVVTDKIDVIASVRDANLSSWRLEARIGETSIATLGSGANPLHQDLAGIYAASMAPPGYVGPVDLVLTASDSASPANFSEAVATVTSDYYLDAYGRLELAPRYEVSTTIPVMASITGELASWRLDIRREGETDPLITQMGTETGEALHIADFDVASTYGPGTYVFDLSVADGDGDLAHDLRVVQFVWRPAHLAITYVGPPLTGPGPVTPLSEFTDPTITGIVEIRGEVTGSNTWVWALGRPIVLSEPSFAGDKIVFSSNIDDPANFDIYQLDLDGTDLIRLTNHPGFDYAPKFSGDGARIVFSSTRDYSAPQLGTDVYMMGSGGTNIKRLTNDGKSSYPAFSPGATHVACQRPEGIFEIELSTNAVEQLTSGEDYFPSYSPNGGQLVFDRGMRGYQQVFVADLNQPGYPASQLVAGAGFSGYPQYSPDGTRLVYVADGEITVASADGTNPRGLGVSGHDPTFTPDTGRIAYAQSSVSGQDKIFLIGSDPDDPGMPEELVIPGSSRVPDVSSPQLPFPPSPATNSDAYIPIDIASFVRSPDPLTYWGYLRAPPDQLPQGERGTDSVLGYIDASRLPPGMTSLSLTALQCPAPPPVFDYGLEIPPDVETSATIAAIATCNAYSTPQIPLRVLPESASVDLRVDVTRSGAGYAGALSAQRKYSATGAWFDGDAWAFSAPSLDGLDVPGLIRVNGRFWASGPPANAGPDRVPVGDLAAIENMDLVIGDPALGLKVLSGLEISPTPVACGELFAPGRTGCRYEVDITPGHFGGATHVTAYSDDPTGLLGAITWSYDLESPGKYAALPGPEGWGSALPPTQTNQVRLVFSGYGRDAALVVPDVEGGS